MSGRRRAVFDALTALVFFGAAATWVTGQPVSWFGIPMAGLLVVVGVWFTSEAWKGWRESHGQDE